MVEAFDSLPRLSTRNCELYFSENIPLSPLPAAVLLVRHRSEEMVARVAMQGGKLVRYARGYTGILNTARVIHPADRVKHSSELRRARRARRVSREVLRAEFKKESRGVSRHLRASARRRRWGYAAGQDRVFPLAGRQIYCVSIPPREILLPFLPPFSRPSSLHGYRGYRGIYARLSRRE